MALTNCKECGKEVSTEAVVCPHCGYPIKTASYLPPPATATRRGVGCGTIIAIIFSILVLLAIIGFLWFG